MRGLPQQSLHRVAVQHGGNGQVLQQIKVLGIQAVEICRGWCVFATPIV